MNLNSLDALSEIRSSLPTGNSSGNATIDMDNGVMTIRKSNLNKYLEKYSCKDEDDLQDTLWFNYGIFVRIV